MHSACVKHAQPVTYIATKHLIYRAKLVLASSPRFEVQEFAFPSLPENARMGVERLGPATKAAMSNYHALGDDKRISKEIINVERAKLGCSKFHRSKGGARREARGASSHVSELVVINFGEVEFRAYPQFELRACENAMRDDFNFLISSAINAIFTICCVLCYFKPRNAMQ